MASRKPLSHNGGLSMPTTTTTFRLPTMILLALLLVGLLQPRSAAAQQLTIYTPPSKYNYLGCYNETTALEGTANSRALDGASQIGVGTMTVQTCLDFCRTGSSTTYKYAGLEFSRECWCGQHLSTLSVKLADSECNTACDGDNKTACGGSLALSVYISAARQSPAVAVSLVMLMAAVSVIVILF